MNVVKNSLVKIGRHDDSKKQSPDTHRFLFGSLAC